MDAGPTLGRPRDPDRQRRHPREHGARDHLARFWNEGTPVPLRSFTEGRARPALERAMDGVLGSPGATLYPPGGR